MPDEPEKTDLIGARDQAAQDQADAVRKAETERADRRREERVGSERLRAYAELVTAIGELLYPASLDDLNRRKRRGVETLLRGELELALKAIAVDTQRLARRAGDAVD